MNEYSAQFKHSIEIAGLHPPCEIHFDGKLHRFSTNGKCSDDSGWYVLHADGIPAGSFGCWRSGIHTTWCAKADHELTDAELQAMRDRMQAIKRQREADEASRNKSAAQEASRQWAAAKDATGHPYLVAKGIKSHGSKVDADGNLLVPMWDTSNKLWNVERINVV